MPEERVSIRKITGLEADKLRALAQEISDAGAEAAGQKADEVDAPAGIILVAFFAVDDRPESSLGVMPISTCWSSPEGIELEPGVRPWAVLTLAKALARQLEDDHDRSAFLQELLDGAKSLADRWFNLVMDVFDAKSLLAAIDDDRPRSARPRGVRRSERPSGRGGRSKKQKRKR
jgi:hypothetical protein